jgi:hypothetical protein
MRVVRRTSPFLKQFGGPRAETQIVCFKFWQAVVASGCPGACAYCFLQTQEPYRTGLYDLTGTLFENLHPRLENETQAWLAASSEPRGLIVGENQDGLAFERPYKALLGTTPLEVLVPLFLSPVTNPAGCRLVVLSKFTTTEHAERAAAAAGLAPNDRVIFSWSLSLPSISKRYERKVAPLARRLEAAARLKSTGWAVRFRLDALSPVEGWQRDVREIVDAINAVGPEMLTLGSLRASDAQRLKRAAMNNGRDGAIFDALRDKDPSGFKYRLDPSVQAAMFRAVKEHLDPAIPLDLCKEDLSVWRRLGLRFTGCHCLAGSADPVVHQRREEGLQLVLLRRAQPRVRALRSAPDQGLRTVAARVVAATDGPASPARESASAARARAASR